MHYNDVVLNLDQIHDQISPFGLQHLYGPTKSDMLKWKNLNLIFWNIGLKITMGLQHSYLLM